MLLIKNGKVLTMAGTTLDKGCILIDDGKIVQIGESIDVDEDARVIDADGYWVMPGLIEAHCHIGLVEQGLGVEGDDHNEISSPITAHLRAIDGINPMDEAFSKAIEAGITGVMTGPGSTNVVCGQFVFIKTSGMCVDDMVVLEPSAMKVAFGENPKKVYSKKNQEPYTRMASVALLRETIYEAINYQKKKYLAQIKGEEFFRDFRLECWLPVLEKTIPIKAHAHRADDILSALRIAKEFDINIILNHCTEGHLVVDYINKSGFDAIVGPSLTSKSKVELSNKTFETPAILSKNGVKIAITTDHPIVPIQYLAHCAGFATKAGLDMEEALKAITINAAQICGVCDRVGSIEVGKDADIAIFTGNPMEVFTDTVFTIINGEIVYSQI